MTPLEQRLLEIVRVALQEAQTPGAAVTLLIDGEPLLEAGAGYRDIEGTEPLAADAQFYLYSITKTVTAVAVLKLVQGGVLALDEPARRYLPELALDEPVTLRQLLRHTAGLPDYGGAPVYEEAVRESPERPWTAEIFLRNTLSEGLRYAPGEGAVYADQPR